MASRLVLSTGQRQGFNPPPVGEWITNTRAWLIGRNLPAIRAYDISSGVGMFAVRSDVDPSSTAAVARGVSGVWLLTAAAAIETRIGRVWLDRTPHSFSSAFETQCTPICTTRSSRASHGAGTFRICRADRPAENLLD